METLWQDIKFSLRSFARSPAFVLTAALTLALGIGAGAAIFSVADAVLFRPLSFPDPQNLVMLWELNPKFSPDEAPVTAPNYLSLKEQAGDAVTLAATQGRSMVLTASGEPERLRGRAVTPNFFSVLGVMPALGRGFTPENEQPGNDQVVILSHGLWSRRFGSDPAVIGNHIDLNNSRYTVVGVMPESFDLATLPADIWVPRQLTERDRQNRGAHMFIVLGRLHPGISLARAQAQIDGGMSALAVEYPQSNSGWTAALKPLAEEGVTSARPVLLTLLGAVMFLLLIACANVANLLSARSVGRSREFAVRLAVGAGRARLGRQLFTESLLMTALGSTLGLMLAVWCVDLFVAIGPRDIPRLQEATVNWRVFAFTVALTALAAFVTSLVPMLQASRIDLAAALKEKGWGATRGFRPLRLITTAEVTLSIALLIGGGLLMKSYGQLLSVDPGIRTGGVLAMSISLPFNKYSQLHQTSGFFQELVNRVNALPGVSSASFIQNLPLAGGSLFFYVDIEGQPPRRPGENLEVEFHSISADYFRTLAIPLLRGRTFSGRDVEHSTPVMIASESLARRYFPDTDPIGKKIMILGNDQPPREIVGVVADVKHRGLDREVREEVYVPHTQFFGLGGTLLVHTASDPYSLASAVKEQVWAVDPNQPVHRVTTMQELLAASVARNRFSSLLVATFAGVALLLASIGIYGVLAYAVSHSTREIGVRMALGAQAGDVFRLVVQQGLTVAGAGILLGLAAGLAVAYLIRGLLFGVAPVDAATFAGVSLLVLLVTAVACAAPAWRAVRVNPIVALHHE